MLETLSASTLLKILAVLGALSAVKELLNAFGNKDNKFIVFFGKVVDFLSANVAHK